MRRSVFASFAGTSEEPKAVPVFKVQTWLLKSFVSMKAIYGEDYQQDSGLGVGSGERGKLPGIRESNSMNGGRLLSRRGEV